MSYLADLLLETARERGGAVTDEAKTEVEAAIEQLRSPVAALLDLEIVDERSFLRGLSEALGFTWWEGAVDVGERDLLQQVPARLALRHQLLPVRKEGETITLLTYDPFDLLARQLVTQALPCPVRWAMNTRRDILQALRKGYGIGADTFDQIIEGRAGDEVFDNLKDEVTSIDEEDSEASVVKFVNQIIREALLDRATDIHIEPLDDDMRIRYRVDGMLHEVPVPPQIKLLQASVISRIKIMSHLDIAERRLPQDGRIALEFEGKSLDVRVATIPSVTGESVSLRLLGQEKFTFERLGLGPRDRERLEKLLAVPNGIILITGPTGSGKSTSLYTFLSALNNESRRIVTIEDPVEHKLPGVVQIAVKPEIDLTFARGLRAILRGDPNVVMIGEMRDVETAEIAIRAALTGHLVFSTLHTNDAIGGITRLIDMGVEPFLVSTSVRAFLAQRLVRRLCEACRKPSEVSDEHLIHLGFNPKPGQVVYQAVGCEACRQSGYQGRVAIFEIAMINQRLSDLIAKNSPYSQLHLAALQDGMRTLRQDGWDKVTSGMTTVEEVLRVTITEEEEKAQAA
jgi:general secretion pathway protein E/type IV pilus assembly protein PilB